MSLVYQGRSGFIPLVALGLGVSFAAHVAVPGLFAGHAAHETPEIAPPKRTSIQGAIMFDLSDVIAAPSDAAEDVAEVAESTEAPTVTDSPETLDPAKASEQPILQQVPFDVDDDSLKFDVAAPDTEADTEEKATDLAQEIQEEHAEQSSVAADNADASTASVSGVDSDQTSDRATAQGEGLSAEQLAEVTEWQKSIVLKIARAKTYPSSARKKKIEGEVRVAFVLDQYGNIISREIETSSGYPVLDEAALKVMDEIGKMPTPPGYLNEDSFRLIIPFKFSIRK